MTTLIERPGLTLVQARGALRLLATDGATGRLAAVAAAHEAVHSPHIPPLEGRALDAAPPGLSFACAAERTAAQVIRERVAVGKRFHYGAAIAFNELLMDAVEAMHARGFYLGAISWENVLIDPEGAAWLVGAGDNYPARAGAGAVPAAGLIEAPEVMLGYPATAASDVFCLYGVLRSLLPFAEVPPFLAALGPGRAQAAAYPEIHALTERASAPDPLRRPGSVAELRSLYRAVRARVPEMPDADPEGLRRVLAEHTRPSAPSLRLDRERRVAALNGATIDLSRRSAQWRILARLCEEHARAPGRAVELDALVAAGWPAERILPRAARARVYVALSGLRKAGLEATLLTRDGGYLLDPALDVQIEP